MIKTALDLAEELILLRDLEYGIHTLASPEYQKMSLTEIQARKQKAQELLRVIKIEDGAMPEPWTDEQKKALMNVADTIHRVTKMPTIEDLLGECRECNRLSRDCGNHG